MGSMIQVGAPRMAVPPPAAVRPSSSPRMLWSGKSRTIKLLSSDSTAQSASVTHVPSAFWLEAMSRRNLRIAVVPARCAISSAKVSSRSQADMGTHATGPRDPGNGIELRSVLLADMATLVTVHAHPDDEAIACGGTIAKAAKKGHRVVIVFGTRGEHGEVAEGFLEPGEELAARREAEAHRAAELLGAQRVEFLGYRDSGMMGTAENDAPGSFWSADVE